MRKKVRESVISLMKRKESSTKDTVCFLFIYNKKKENKNKKISGVSFEIKSFVRELKIVSLIEQKIIG